METLLFKDLFRSTITIFNTFHINHLFCSYFAALILLILSFFSCSFFFPSNCQLATCLPTYCLNLLLLKLGHFLSFSSVSICIALNVHVYASWESDVYLTVGWRSPAAFQQNFGYLCFTFWQWSVDEFRLRGSMTPQPAPCPVYATESYIKMTLLLSFSPDAWS